MTLIGRAGSRARSPGWRWAWARPTPPHGGWLGGMVPQGSVRRGAALGRRVQDETHRPGLLLCAAALQTATSEVSVPSFERGAPDISARRCCEEHTCKYLYHAWHALPGRRWVSSYGNSSNSGVPAGVWKFNMVLVWQRYLIGDLCIKAADGKPVPQTCACGDREGRGQNNQLPSSDVTEKAEVWRSPKRWAETPCSCPSAWAWEHLVC